ncbi:efflux RND transporter periplasmic adaptor subunit [Cytophaga aurantiaca]|uniref:efflux RND transporter periplasmic adaptor subunit n=1 Tax=Cytophaga aurantiaca TaxID=29530 RepID=UPI0003731E3C|nr:efflux RND transporter periplasmic adaptor subunit [Cytophaga aurantiaca]
MKLKFVVYALIIIGIAALIYYRVVKNKEINDGGKSQGISDKAIGVNGIVLQPQEFSNTILISGSIGANEQVQIRSQVTGIITHIYFNEGSTVKQGQSLVKIDDAELQAQLSELLIRENLASENEQRAKSLLQKEGISKEEYEITLSALKSLQAQSQIIRTQISKTIIKAPFDGTIGLRNVSVGEYVTTDIVIANLVNINPVKITFSVPEKYASSMKVNTKVRFTFAGSGKTYTAIIYAIEPGIDEVTRTIQLRAKASNNDGALLPGSFANIELPLTTIKDALLIPTEAVIPIQDGKKVFIVKNGKAKEAIIKTTSRTDKDLLVLSGLQAGDTVLTTGVMSMKQGTSVKVKITNADQHVQ